MKKIFETSQIKEIDQYTIKNEPIESIDLVERAASVFVNEFCRRYASTNQIFIFAGPGNNGADALSIARLLLERNYKPFSYLINPSKILSPDCDENRRQLKMLDSSQLVEVEGGRFLPPELKSQDIVIDGLFGSGLNKPLSGGYAAMVNYINHSEATVVSIDVPSGLFGEDNKVNNFQYIIQADLTLTFEFPKLAFLFPENADFVGEWKVLPIGLHPDAIMQMKTSYGLITDEFVASLLHKRERFAHKGDFGHALLLAGSTGKMGAALLSAKGCLRSGVGLLTVHLPSTGELALQISLPEAMTDADTNRHHITELPSLSQYHAIGIGPGIGMEKETVEVLKKLLEEIGDKPLVLDADALNIISSYSELLRRLPQGTIITPHPKEFDRLAGASENAYDRMQKARLIASDQKIYVVLKGAYTAVCTPSGEVFFNPSGNPGMATGGSGDVLTGILTGLLAQGYTPGEATIIGVYLHGFAGNLAAAAFSEESMIAGDIVMMLGKTFKQMSDDDYS